MRSIIICEGSTDFTLLQYYMKKVHSWSECGKGGKSTFNPKGFDKSKSRDFSKNENLLTIISAGGCAGMPNLLLQILLRNLASMNDDEIYSKVVYLTDNDEEQTKEDVFSNLKKVCGEVGVCGEFANNEWSEVELENKFCDAKVEILPLVIPFNEKGALETFLLETLRKNNEYDASVIDRGNAFVDMIASEKCYLKHRRDVVKAKLNLFFSVKTPAEQFAMRQDILKNIAWEEYENVQMCFKELANLG